MRDHCLLGIVVGRFVCAAGATWGRGSGSKLSPRDIGDQVVALPRRRSCDWLTVIPTTPLEAGQRPAQAQSVVSLGTPVGETMALNKNHSEGGGVIVNNTER